MGLEFCVIRAVAGVYNAKYAVYVVGNEKYNANGKDYAYDTDEENVPEHDLCEPVVVANETEVPQVDAVVEDVDDDFGQAIIKSV